MPYPRFKIDHFNGGINESLDDSLITLNEAKEAQNCRIDDGTLRSMLGATTYIETGMTTPIGTLMPYYVNGFGTMLMAIGSSVYAYSEVEGVMLPIMTNTTSDKFDFVNFQNGEDNVIIFGNGVEPTKIFDGSVCRNLKNYGVIHDEEGNVAGYIDGNNVVHSSASQCTTLAPKGKYMELHYERIWMAGDSSHPDRLYFSTANTDGFFPEDWTYPVSEGEANQHGGFIEIPTWDGGNIIGLKVVFDEIVIFKNKNIFKIFGTFPGNYTKVQLYSTTGGIADRSIVSGDNRAYFLSTDGIYAYDGTNVYPIHTKIKKTFDLLNKDMMVNAVGTFYDNKYILAVPEGDTDKNNLIIIYDTLNQNFMFIRGLTINHFAEYENRLVCADESGSILEMNNDTTFLMSPITSYYETGFTDLGAKNAQKTVQYLYFRASGYGSIKIQCKTERATVEKTVVLTPDETLYKIKLRNKGRMIALRFENIDGSVFTIKSPELTLDVDYD